MQPVRDERLGAVDDVVVTVAHGRRLMPRRSEPAPGSVMRDRADELAARPAAAARPPRCSSRAVREHVMRRDLVHALAEAREAGVQQLLVDHALEPEVAARARRAAPACRCPSSAGLPALAPELRRRRIRAPASASSLGRISRSIHAPAVSRKSSCSSLAQGEWGKKRGGHRAYHRPAPSRPCTNWGQARGHAQIRVRHAICVPDPRMCMPPFCARRPQQTTADDGVHSPHPGRPCAARYALRLRAR